MCHHRISIQILRRQIIHHVRIIAIIQPKVICALGNFAAKTLLNSERPISQLRGRFHDFQGAKLICTFHPAYLLRNPSRKPGSPKSLMWQDIKEVRRVYDSLVS